LTVYIVEAAAKTGEREPVLNVRAESEDIVQIGATKKFTL
jgi:hypothetical protein